MDLIIPILGASAAFGLLILGLCFKYMWDVEELFILTMIFSTIMFFVSGVCWLGVTYIDPTTGALVQDHIYDFFIWLMVPFGFVPILLLIEHSFEGFEKSD